MPFTPLNFPPSSSPDTGPVAPIVVRFGFRGTAVEFFRIWLVNTLLTIVTLGLFSPWAKVRARRYLYGSALLNNANFDYHASPWSILFARIVVVLVVVGGAYAAGEDLLRIALHSTLLALLLPWALVRGFAFNARYSSHRSTRFSFRKQTFSAYHIFAPILLLSVLLSCLELVFPNFDDETSPGFHFIGILLSLCFIGIFAGAPWLLREWHDFKARNHSLGPVQFHFKKPPPKAYFFPLWGIPALGTVFLAFVILPQFQLANPENIESRGPLAILSAFLVMLLIFTFIRAALFRLFWNHIGFSVDGNLGKFRADFSVVNFAVTILFVNYLAIFFSLGLLYPWATIRRAKFIAEHLSLETTPAALEKIPVRRGESEGALGEEFDAEEGIDFDVGLV